MRIGCVGEVMVELGVDQGDTARLGVAGDTYNTAVYLRRAAPASVAVRYITRLGQDSLSTRILRALEGEGIETSEVTRDPDRVPGLYAIETDPAGERAFTYWRDRSAARQMFAHGFAALEGVEVIYLSAISLAILPPEHRAGLMAKLADLRARQGTRVAFDSNYRPRLWESAATAQDTIAAMWALTDIALPSLDDEMALFGDADARAVQDRLARAGVRTGALKRGALGPLPLGGAEVVAQAYPPAPVVRDSTAAGDSFNGAFLSAHVQGAPLAEAMAAGHACAAWVVQHPGAIAPPHPGAQDRA